jgi:hypothetical protein
LTAKKKVIDEALALVHKLKALRVAVVAPPEIHRSQNQIKLLDMPIQCDMGSGVTGVFAIQGQKVLRASDSASR